MDSLDPEWIPLASQLKESVYGPYLKLLEYTAPTEQSPARWSGSILYVCKSTFLNDRAVTLLLNYRGSTEVINAEWLDRHDDWLFWKFQIDLELVSEEQEVSYHLKLDDELIDQCWSFYVPGDSDGWHIAAYSCSGFSHDTKREEWMIDGDHPMVSHLMNLHNKKPIHACLGGGDQLYNDELFDLKIMLKWLETRNRHERLSQPFNEVMERHLVDFYFAHYCEHFNVGSLRDMCAKLPNVMLWDDHDIFDGWGSYPEDMMCAPVFQGIFKTARRFYLLFQHHTTMELIQKGKSDLFMGTGETPALSFLKYLGPEVAVLGVDIRSERTKTRVLCDESWTQIFKRLANMPSSIQHLIVVFTVPIVYPHVPIAEALFSLVSIMTKVAVLNAVLVKTNIVSSKTFDEPELLDDLIDHWTSPHHIEERKIVVQNFQKLAWHHDVRVTFLSGDVHCAGLGRFYTSPKAEKLIADPNFMPQIITSAIINEPPPPSAVSLMHTFDVAGNRVNSHTREKMVKLFKEKFPSQHKVLPRRNFITIDRLPDQNLEIVFFVENQEEKSEEPLPFKVIVPILRTGLTELRGGRTTWGNTIRRWTGFLQSFTSPFGSTGTSARETWSTTGRNQYLHRSTPE
eukprot:g5108.t1